MTTSNPFSSFLIGTESLLIACGDLLISNGHEIRGVISSEPPIVEWARTNSLRVLDPDSDYSDALAERPFDYLLSITNLRIIPPRILALPTRGAINFHDGPLPAYGGLFAPVWALIDEQPGHGISWHMMSEDVDAGGIVAQAHFDITPTETAFTLNTRCYSAGIESFTDLMRDMASNSLAPIPTAVDRKTWHTRATRPAGNCALNWNSTAEQLSVLSRALDFGGYPNAFGIPKLVLGDGIILAHVIEVASSEGRRNTAPVPGTLLSADDAGMRIAVSDGDVSVSRLTTVDGEPISGHDVLRRFKLSLGDRLPDLDQSYLAAIDQALKALARHEDFWVHRLSQLDGLALPYLSSSAASSGAAEFSVARIPEAAAEQLKSQISSSSGADRLTVALAAWLARLSGSYTFDVAFSDASVEQHCIDARVSVSRTIPMRFNSAPSASCDVSLRSSEAELERMREHATYFTDVAARYPAVFARRHHAPRVGISQVESAKPERLPGTSLTIVVSEDGATCRWVYDPSAISSDSVTAMQNQFARFADCLSSRSASPLHSAPLLDDVALHELAVKRNATDLAIPDDACIHDEFSGQAARTPAATAVSFEGSELTYRELDLRSNQLARHLRGVGVGPDVLVGVCIARSTDVAVALLGILKAGGAYVPLDPAYPAARIAHMVDDSQITALISHESLSGNLPATDARIICIDRDWGEIARASDAPVDKSATPDNLAYVIYTSGSTGAPKGVMVEHRNVINFFSAMDERLGESRPGVWLAVTSLSFDISVLELLWTLARGFKVVIQGDAARHASPSVKLPNAAKSIDFSLFYFSADEGSGGSNKYELLMEGAKYADRNGFSAVWTPERHFHAFGGLYPNPAVTGAAVAAITEHVAIRAGSCVLPLHHPVRVAEEWSVVDNISNGRVGISFASGWQPNDFLLRPENFADARQVMLRDIETVRKLWRGEAVSFPGPNGADISVSILPRPVQAELPFWLTTAGNPESFAAAGRVGANVLTHLLGQTVEELGQKIAVYRKAWSEAGHSGDGIVSLMLHAFVGDDDASVKETVREPMKEYLRTSIGLIKPYASAFPTFRKTAADGTKQELDFENLTAEEMDSLLEYSFERYYETSGLFGAPDRCVAMVDTLKGIGVDDVACLIDFGVEPSLVLAQLSALNQVRQRANESSSGDYSIAAEVSRHGVTHMQCTPSMATMLLADTSTRKSLRGLRKLLIGGEAFPIALAEQLRSATNAEILNMYGPTETTIWSTVGTVGDTREVVSIGRPVANTQLYIADTHGQPVPDGLPGELYIGGKGVVRGYFRRPDLTAERFVDLPWAVSGGARTYRTGDVVRYQEDGNLEYLGRLDHQVKIRGYRIELGEIEAVLERHPHVKTAVVAAREDSPGDKRIVAYVVPVSGNGEVTGNLRDYLRGQLPDFMVPSNFAVVDRMPMTPNGKIDRGALPNPDTVVRPVASPLAPPQNELEQTIAAIWREVLKLERVGVTDNFFDLGGHSLLAVKAFGQLEKKVTRSVSITDLFRFPTIRALATHLARESEDNTTVTTGIGRAAARRQSMARRGRQR